MDCKILDHKDNAKKSVKPYTIHILHIKIFKYNINYGSIENNQVYEIIERVVEKFWQIYFNNT